jgi:CRP-like cAMP-binding protein
VQTAARLDPGLWGHRGDTSRPIPNANYQTGKYRDSFFLILQGRVDVVLEDIDGGEQVVNTLGKGQYFGEMALMGNRRRSATVRAADRQASVVELTLGDFERLLEHSEIFGDRLNQIVAERQKQLDRARDDMGNQRS